MAHIPSSQLSPTITAINQALGDGKISAAEHKAIIASLGQQFREGILPRRNFERDLDYSEKQVRAATDIRDNARAEALQIISELRGIIGAAGPEMADRTGVGETGADDFFRDTFGIA